MDVREFEGKKIIVVGASSGIGQACAIQLGQRGASVVLVGRNLERLKETAAHIPEKRGAILPCDVSDFDAAQAMVKEAVKLDGVKLDGCVFSAGLSFTQPVISAREDTLLSMFQTNFMAFAAVLKAFASRRMSNNGSSFVAISSQASRLPFKGQSGYSATKAAVDIYAAIAALELAPRRIRVNTVCPEMVDTPMGKGMHLLSPERLQERFPLGALTAEDIADTVLYLLSDSSKKITGQAIPITAGCLFADSGDNVVF